MPIHPPGWDWWRIYPWSRFNYGRNPYNPIVVPYDVSPYPVYAPVDTSAYPPVPAPTAVIPSTGSLAGTNGIEVSGPLSTPPPHTAVINLRVPSYWASVTINGQRIDSTGTSRTFVTPALSGRRSYTVAATWSRHGHQTQFSQTVQVEPGHMVTLDFSHRGE
jgi:uncharacterized protein (TIGR03000 family)